MIKDSVHKIAKIISDIGSSEGVEVKVINPVNAQECDVCNFDHDTFHLELNYKDFYTRKTFTSGMWINKNEHELIALNLIKDLFSKYFQYKINKKLEGK